MCEETRTLDLVVSSCPTLISLHYVSPAMLPQLQGCRIMKLLSSILISQQSRPTKRRPAKRSSTANPSPIYGHEVNQVMLDIANDYGLEQLVCEETRTLDLVFSSRPTLISLHYVSPAMLPQLQGCRIMKLLSSILISQQSRPTKKAARKTFIYRKPLPNSWT